MGDDETLHCQAWGGVNVLAEVLFHVQKNRVPYEFDRFVKKIRVYTISDQDNTGPWIRYASENLLSSKVDADLLM